MVSNFLAGGVVIVVMLLGPDVTAPQAAEVPPIQGCPFDGVVRNYKQLVLALRHFAQTGTCPHITIPVGTTLDLEKSISIGDVHTGLHLTIAGTIRWTGIPERDGKMFQLDGHGMITSIYDPAQYVDQGIGRAIRILGSHSVTIRDLNCTKMGSMVQVETGGGTTDLQLINLHADNMVDYGVWTNDVVGLTVRNCSVRRAGLHSFRLYGNNLNVEDCSSHNAQRTGLWIPYGVDVVVNGMASDTWIRFGPDNGPDGGPGDRLLNLIARRIDTTDIVTVEMGTVGATFIDLCSTLLIGRPAEQVTHPKPLDNVHWANVAGIVTVVFNPLNGPNIGDAPGVYCFADIVRDGEVDVNDILAVINGWGRCPPVPGGSGFPYPPCAGDIVPIVCGNHFVNLDDLLAVLNAFGVCP